MDENNRMTKRGFLKKLLAFSGAFASFSLSKRELMSEPGIIDKDEPPLPEMPMIQFGKYKISKLMVGGNPISGNSHVSSEVSQSMLDYFSEENVINLLRLCEENGINTWQSRGDRHIMRLLRVHRDEGGKLYWIVQTASEMADIPKNIKTIASNGAIGIYHHGSKTDEYWKNGQIDKVNEMLKVMRDTGVMVGLGSHIPEALEYAEEKGWDIDFYMACFYNPLKKRGQIDEKTGKPFRGEYYGDEDRDRMCKFIRQTDKICFGYKILAASRKCQTPESTKKAFEYALKNIKKNDAVVVGMFWPYHAKEDTQYVKTIWREINSI